MRCEDVRERLMEADLQDLQPLRPHLDACPECARLAELVLAAEADLHRALDAYEDRSFNEAWTAAKRVRDNTQRRRFMSYRYFHGGLAMAAAALVTVVAVGRVVPSEWVPASWVSHADEGDWDAVVTATESEGGRAELAALWEELADLEPDELRRHQRERFALAVRIGQLSEGRLDKAPFAVEREGVPYNRFFLEAIDIDRASGGKLVPTLPDPLASRVTAEAQLAPIRARVAEAADLPWNALSTEDWMFVAVELADLLPAAEADGTLKYQLHCQIGSAAENANNPIPRFYRKVSGTTVNYHFYLAGALAHERPELLSPALTPAESIRSQVAYYRDKIETGEFELP